MLCEKDKSFCLFQFSFEFEKLPVTLQDGPVGAWYNPLSVYYSCLSLNIYRESGLELDLLILV